MNRSMLLVALAYLSIVAVVAGQEAPEIPADPGIIERNVAALESIAESLDSAIQRREALAEEVANDALGEDRRREIESQLELERERITQDRRGFRNLIGGVEAAEFDAGDAADSNVQDQLGEVLKPLLAALREPTARLREMEDMRKARDVWGDRRDMAERVLGRINAIEAAGGPAIENPRFAVELEAARRQWESLRNGAAAEFDVLSLQIEERERNTPSFWQTVTAMTGDFIKSRGLNLLIALLTGVLAFMLTRRGYAWFRRISPVHAGGGGSLIGRASDLIAFTTAVLVSITCVLAVFFARGDWLLLTITAILIVGALWAGKTALPPYVEQIRTLLNLGNVREGERVNLRGLPWRVKSLNFHSIFENPELQGGVLRIPLRDVMGMVSRPSYPDEPWFPSKPGDWVVLKGGSHGQVLHQTPEQVVLVRRGGSHQTFQTEDFLDGSPENLMAGFRVRSIFGIDYAHQAISTTEVPEVLREGVERAIIDEFGSESVRAVVVEFHEAGSSSLDFAVKVDLTKDAAPRYRFVPRLIQRACVDVCNARGWVIPFTQITLHRADG